MKYCMQKDPAERAPAAKIATALSTLLPGEDSHLAAALETASPPLDLSEQIKAQNFYSPLFP